MPECKKNRIILKKYDVKSLDLNDQKEANGGFLLTLPVFAFAWGVGYGYVKEKFETNQW